MAHDRKRDIIARLKKMIRFSPIVGIFGHRQVGKTHLASQLGAEYVTFDRQSELEIANRDPEHFLTRFTKSPVVIDECQLCPPLFPALKEHVRIHRQPGQFILTGSVRFTSRRAIRESLTGRLVQLELLPMGMSEMEDAPLSDFLPRLMKLKKGLPARKPSPYFNETRCTKFQKTGGLPGICFIRDNEVRTQKLQTLIETLLERDLRLLVETTLSFQSLIGLLRFLAANQGEPLDWASMSRKTRISRPTLKKLFYAFESMYLLRQIPTEGDLTRPSYFLEDQGEASFLAPGKHLEYSDLLRLIYSNIRMQFLYRPELQSQFFRYQSRSGSEIPIAVRTRYGVLGVLPSLERNPTRSTIGSADSFLTRYPTAKVVIIHLYDHASPEILSDSLFNVPGKWVI